MTPLSRLIRLFPLLFAPLIMVAACDEGLPAAEPALVVEGWIDDGDFPVVFVTTTMPVSGDKTSTDDLSPYLLKWARVAVNDGEREVVLTGRKMHGQPIPYGFTTGEMRGKAGRTYHLSVSAPPYSAEAETTIPMKAEVDSFTIKNLAGNDTLYEVKAHVSRPVDGAGGYKLFVMRKNKDNYFLSAYMGLFTPENVQGNVALPVYNGHVMNVDKFTPYFAPRDTLQVKFAAVSEEGYQFWLDYESRVSLASSPFLGSSGNLRGNVQGALGYWLGYGASKYLLCIPQKSVSP